MTIESNARTTCFMMGILHRLAAGCLHPSWLDLDYCCCPNPTAWPVRQGKTGICHVRSTGRRSVLRSFDVSELALLLRVREQRHGCFHSAEVCRRFQDGHWLAE